MTDNFKIHFQLQELDKVTPWGSNMHWFGLTDGLLWIEVGNQTIYEYSEAAQTYFGNTNKYNDYQIVRFLEDFFCTLKYVGESIPKELYDDLEQFDAKAESWKESYIEEEDDIFDKFYYDEYCELREWYSDRSYDSGHLVGGPYIGCFRYEDHVKIRWESSFQLEDGSSIWTSPKGCVEMPYDRFVTSISEFLEAFFVSMDAQVKAAVEKDWGNVSLDKERLVQENEERKAGFRQDVTFLKKAPQNTDWDKIMMLYSKMKAESGI